MRIVLPLAMTCQAAGRLILAFAVRCKPLLPSDGSALMSSPTCLPNQAVCKVETDYPDDCACFLMQD